MKHSFAWVALLLLWLSACSPAVTVEQQAGTNFANYRTYAWADTEVKTQGDQNPLLRSSIAQTNIQQAIEGELSKRGLRRVDDNPDFYLTTHLYVEQAERTVSDPPPAGFAYPYAVRYRGALLPVNYGYWYSPAYYRTSHVERYREGTLVLDFIDARTNNLVWRGSMADPVDDPARLGPQFAEAAKDILEKFPKGKTGS
ncbi:DUF4136 domain-containing protein [Hymenobacter sp. DH14]|uniref:DUF4136 domain-containing protein n=1 Tax=Hymenobacter cyanobacteriorum TaxID=2926463 RepID=A0A9X1VJH0_9BACT|nr:DUF4136 domain-containing protein [Hymenobacter cyanobacteriorum]MCI1189976.1 DUF4136 domain-containing protein [Hymenobacter cyanobacteriorum]